MAVPAGQGVGRVVVGVSGLPSSLEALRAAVDEARRRRVELLAVLAWTPVGGETGYRRAPCPDLLALWERLACARLRNSFDEAFGGYPDGVVVRPVVVRAAPGYGLVELADRPDDLLVLGAGERGWPARWFHGGTSRYCVSHARCRTQGLSDDSRRARDAWHARSPRCRNALVAPLQGRSGALRSHVPDAAG